MAYLQQTATDLNDILAKANTFFSGQGWTTRIATDSSKYYGDVWVGTRLHLEKSIDTDIGAVVCYANLRSANNQQVYEADPTEDGNYNVTGIACYCSRGYNAGSAWDYQPTGPLGYDKWPSTTWHSTGGVCHLRKTASIQCHFFSGTHSGAIVMEGVDQFFHCIFGVTDLGVPFWSTDGGANCNQDTTSEYKNSKSAFTMRTPANSNAIGHQGCFVNDAAKGVANEFIWRLCASANMNSLNETTIGGRGAMIGYSREDDNVSICNNLIKYNPDSSTANPLLVPLEAYTADDFESLYYAQPILLGTVPDAALISVKYLGDGSVIDIGSVSWVVFSCYPIYTFNTQYHGYAFRK